MPYTPTIRAFLDGSSVRHGDQIMTSRHKFRIRRCAFRITDPTINADYGTVQARASTYALDQLARKMGWKSYDEYAAAVANHNGVRTLIATKVSG